MVNTMVVARYNYFRYSASLSSEEMIVAIGARYNNDNSANIVRVFSYVSNPLHILPYYTYNISTHVIAEI